MASSRARPTPPPPDPLQGPAAVALLDDAISLLRRAPVGTVAIYYFGALPFALGLVYFWSDMGESANAAERLPGEALLVAALYFWMKTCQAVFARHLLAQLEGEDAEPWTFSRWTHTALLQVIYAGSLVLVYPLALLITLPFGWVNAFYHNISILATSSKSTLASSFREAAELAQLWPRQNHLILGVQLLAAFVLFLNLGVFFFALPLLLNSLFGIETVFDENRGAWNNSSFYLYIFVFCFLLLNPLSKAVFVLRCFYGRARLSGADLRAELRRWNGSPTGAKALRAGALALIFLFAAGPHVARADSNPPPSTAPAASAPADLDQAIQKTLKRDEFAWRLPRAESPSSDPGFFTKLINRCVDYLRGLVKDVFKWVGDFLKWLFDTPRDHDSADQAISAMAKFPWRALVLLVALVLAGMLLYTGLQRYRRRRDKSVGTPLQVVPARSIDLEAENIRADELPEDSWLALAQQLIERGELRLALRAFYLATLAALARRELVRLAAAKSNRDYLAEVTRRSRGENSVVALFRENVRLFEASWYGTHDVTPGVIDTMRSNQHRMQGHVAA
jgi:hypothetical protein